MKTGDHIYSWGTYKALLPSHTSFKIIISWVTLETTESLNGWKGGEDPDWCSTLKNRNFLLFFCRKISTTISQCPSVTKLSLDLWQNSLWWRWLTRRMPMCRFAPHFQKMQLSHWGTEMSIRYYELLFSLIWQPDFLKCFKALWKIRIWKTNILKNEMGLQLWTVLVLESCRDKEHAVWRAAQPKINSKNIISEEYLLLLLISKALRQMCHFI